jgi:hypothetical protein
MMSFGIAGTFLGLVVLVALVVLVVLLIRRVWRG